MKRILLPLLVVLTFSAVSAPALAMKHPLSSTSNALPLLEIISVHGKVTQINGRQVQIRSSSGEVETYHISRARQQQHELAVGSEVTLGVRRFNHAVITIKQ